MWLLHLRWVPEGLPPSVDADVPGPPQSPMTDLAAVLTTITGLKAGITSLSDDMQSLADKVNQMGNKFEQEVHRLEARQDRQFSLLNVRLKQMETIQGSVPKTIARPAVATDSGTSISVSLSPAPETFLPLATK